MRNFFKKCFMVIISISLMISPMLVEATTKKSQAHASVKTKSHIIKVRASKKAVKASSRKKIRMNLSRANHRNKITQTNFDRDLLGEYDGSGHLVLASSKALIVNQRTGETLYAKNTDLPTPIASVTKLMTAMVVLDAKLPMNEYVTVTDEDVDTVKGTHSRLRVGTALTRMELIQLALIASENRAASALGHAYPGGINAFVVAMNAKAKFLGMAKTHFVDSSGLNSGNVSTAEDLVKMVNAAYQYPEIRQVTTTASQEVVVSGMSYPLKFVNTNGLVRKGEWDIGLSKTGFINEAGRCLVMQAKVAGQPLIMVLLDSSGKNTRIGDANRVRKWMEAHNADIPAEEVDTLMLDRTLGQTAIQDSLASIN